MCWRSLTAAAARYSCHEAKAPLAMTMNRMMMLSVVSPIANERIAAAMRTITMGELIWRNSSEPRRDDFSASSVFGP
jgi:hypothetical protein